MCSGVEALLLSAHFDEPVRVVLNRPFVFFVKDTKLDTIIFAGKVACPQQK
jgi:serine protease inhibitor